MRARDSVLFSCAARQACSSSGSDSSFLPSPFPTFGLSKRTQIWIYGALALILGFCASLAVYLFLARRKRLRLAGRDDYEFEVLADEDEGGRGGGVGAGVATGAGGARDARRKRRAGELYDAFAGESDEELLSGDEEDRYRDLEPRPVDGYEEGEGYGEKGGVRG